MPDYLSFVNRAQFGLVCLHLLTALMLPVAKWASESASSHFSCVLKVPSCPGERGIRWATAPPGTLTYPKSLPSPCRSYTHRRDPQCAWKTSPASRSPTPGSWRKPSREHRDWWGSSSCLRFQATLEHFGEQYQDSKVRAKNSSQHTGHFRTILYFDPGILISLCYCY